jgi:uncharacterized membrane protein YbhN (UPF0104 family)
MTEAAAPTPEVASSRTDAVLPFHDRSRTRRIVKVLAWLVGIGLLVLILNLLGVDVSGWLSEMWDTLTQISFGYLVAGWFFQTLQTTLTAVGWYFILKAGFPHGFPTYLQVLAAYAAGVALNGFLPANIGTFVTLLMFVAIIPHANLPGILGAMVVQKIFFTVIGTVVYLYLFLSVPGSFDLQLGQPHDHPWLTALIILGGGFLLVVLCRVFWRKLKGLWESAKQGGVILSRPRDYVVQVLLPSIGAWLSKLAVIAVFLAAYSIPVTFHSVMSVVGGNSLANTVSATPGGVGVNQAVNVIALEDYANPATATAYSLGQQLAVTFWNIAFGIVLVVWAFGWTGGKLLVRQSYVDAKETVAEQKAQRAAKKEAKKAAEAEAE